MDGLLRRTAVLLVAGLVLVALGAVPAPAAPDVSPVRVAGADRIGTAAEVARTFVEPVPETSTALVARADAFPDALSAAALAGAVGGPVLLTAGDRLSPATRDALRDLAIDEVVVLGGTAAVSATVEAELSRDHVVTRLAGANRYATAATVALAAAERAPVGTHNGRRTVLLATGMAFADALTAGAPAAAGPHPLLLTTRDVLPDVTAEALDELGAEHVVVVGGPAAVSEAVLRAVADRGPSVERVAGPERTATAARLADALIAGWGFSEEAVLLARGDAFPDALSGGPWAGQERAPILLTADPTQLGPTTSRWLAERCGRTQAVSALGGTAAIAPQTVDEALRAIRVCAAGAPVVFGVATTADPGTGVDPQAFADDVHAVLDDPAGWARPGELELQPAAPSDADVIVRLVPGETLAERCPRASACRDGAALLITARGWRSSPEPWGDDLAGYRRYLVNHLLGHWLGQGHGGCPEAGAAAPVMQHQEGDLAGCRPSSRPSSAERDAVLRRYLPSVTVALAGDVHGEGIVRQELLAGRNPLAPIAPVLSAADLAVVNLETAVGTSGRPAAKTYTFQAPPQLVDALASAGVDVVSLANNHALDYGVEAMFETIRHAERAGLAVVGAGRDAAEAYAPAVLEVRGQQVAVVGLSRVLSPGWAAGPGRPGLASAYDEAAAVDAVRRAAAAADHVVVAIHWGVELADCPDPHQRRLARLLTDAGADVVAGHHPHVLQGLHELGDSLVAYSLGNFVWYHRRAPSRYTGVLTARLGTGLEHSFTPAEIDSRGRPIPASGALAEAIRARVAQRSPGGGLCAS